MEAISPDSFKDCLVQLIFGRQLRLAAEQAVHFVQLKSKLFSLGEHVSSSVQSLASSA